MGVYVVLDSQRNFIYSNRKSICQRTVLLVYVINLPLVCRYNRPKYDDGTMARLSHKEERTVSLTASEAERHNAG